MPESTKIYLIVGKYASQYLPHLSWNGSIQFLNILELVFAIQKIKEAHQTSKMEPFVKKRCI